MKKFSYKALYLFWAVMFALTAVLVIVTLVLLIVSRVRSRRSTQPTSDHAITETIDEKQN